MPVGHGHGEFAGDIGQRPDATNHDGRTTLSDKVDRQPCKRQNFDIIEQINEAGVTIFMVEQNANMALSIADRGYVLLTGSIVLADTAENLLANEDLRKAYLGEAD